MQRAQHRAVAAEHDRDLHVLGRRRVAVARLDELDARLARATASSCARPEPIAVGAAVQHDGGARDAATATASSIQRSRSSGSVGSVLSIRWTKNSRLPFGPGRPESTTPATRAAPPGRRGAHVAEHPAAHLRVADDALRRVGPARLELRLHEDERLPAGRGEPQQRRQRRPHGDERDVADDELAARTGARHGAGR